MTTNPPNQPLTQKEPGDLLLEQGKLTEPQLEQARRRQRRLNMPQHRAIVDLNLASEEDTWRALAQVHNLEFVDPAALDLSRETLQLVPMKFIFHYRMVPIGTQEDCVILAFSEPLTQMEEGNLRLLLSKRFRPVLATPSSIHAVIKKNFGLGAETIQRLREDRGLADANHEIVFDVKSHDQGAVVDATVANFVDEVLVEALRLDATDIHIEPYPTSIRLRYRIDGVLQSVPVPAGLRQVYGAIVSRLKVMAGLNIAEKRLPHDGRIAMKTAGEEYDLRVSVIPTNHGESVCLRILGRQSLFLDLAQLGMEPDQEALIKQLTQLPQGLILITGPTGSGKTTTLYATLAHANDEGRKIITIENPVEYQLESISQIQTRDEIGLTFASGLRSVLRHDPDVILIGEIRDTETAEIAVRAAQTGHLVFSTLHTNDSISAITRLLEMKIEPIALGSSLVCSIAQRLAQRICRHCIALDDQITNETRQEMAAELKIRPETARAWFGRGCIECNQRGYRGRTAIYEFFILNDEIADMLEPGIKTGHLRDAARRYGWRPLRSKGWLKVHAGLISVAELERLTRRVKP
jgi:general secretion pathway protein E/type IV pilus assembly protein PilB